jgi:hypothetical protein
MATLIAGAASCSAYADVKTCEWPDHVSYCEPCEKNNAQSYIEQYCKEYLIIKQYPRVFSRKGPKLTIHVSKGEERTYLDVPDPESPSGRGIPSFTLVDYFSGIGYALIHVDYGENIYYLFVNLPTGQSFDIHGVLSLSPDGKYIAVSDGNETFGGEKLAIYAVLPDHLVKEFDTDKDGFTHGLEIIANKFGPWIPHSIKWSSNNEFSFVAEPFDCLTSKCAPGKFPTKYFFSKRKVEKKYQWWLN